MRLIKKAELKANCHMIFSPIFPEILVYQMKLYNHFQNYVVNLLKEYHLLLCADAFTINKNCAIFSVFFLLFFWMTCQYCSVNTFIQEGHGNWRIHLPFSIIRLTMSILNSPRCTAAKLRFISFNLILSSL